MISWSGNLLSHPLRIEIDVRSVNRKITDAERFDEGGKYRPFDLYFFTRPVDTYAEGALGAA